MDPRIIIIFIYFQSFITLWLAISFSNLYAPQHLIVNVVKCAERWPGVVDAIENAELLIALRMQAVTLVLNYHCYSI